MKPDLMERVRRLDPVPEPSAHPPAAMLESIVAVPREASRRPAGRRRRLVLLTTVPAAAAVAIMVVVGVRATRAPEDPLAALPAARVDWGMDVRVTLHPDPDVGIDEMRTRLKTAIAQRSEQLDAAGITVSDVTYDTMTIRLPGTQSASEVQSFLRFERLQVLDAKRSTLGRAATLEELKPAVAAAGAAPGGRTVVYVQPEGRPSQPISAPMRFTKAAAPGMIASLRRSQPSRKIFTLEVPADTFVVGDRRSEPTEFFLIRPVRLVPAVSVDTTVRGSIGVGPTAASHVVVDVDPAATLPSDPTDVMVMTIGTGNGPDDETSVLGRGSLSSDMRSVTLTGDSTLLFFAQRFGQSDVGGTIAIDDPAGWGTRPRLDGRRVTPAPRSLDAFAAADAVWMDVVPGSGQDDARSPGLMIATRANRVVAVATTGPGSFARGTSSGRGICEDGVGSPRVRLCEAGTGGFRFEGRLIRMDTAIGRVQHDVARVAVRTQDGTWLDATIENGWFMATADTIGPRPKGEPAHLFRTPWDIRAWDRSGNPVPVVWPFYG